MVATLGEAHDHGWKLRAKCAHGKGDGMKRIRECVNSMDLDLPTLLWTRGRDFPLALLSERLKCPSCGSYKVVVYFLPPSNMGRQRVS